MKLILVPQWVERALKSESLPLDTVLDPEKLLATLSREDVAFFGWLNDHLDILFEDEIFSSFNTGCRGALNFTDEQMRAFQDIHFAFRVRQNAKAGENTVSRDLFGPTAERCEIDEIGFSTRCIGKDAVVLIPEKATTPSLMGMVNDLLFHLTNRHAFHEIANTDLFRYYVKLV